MDNLEVNIVGPLLFTPVLISIYLLFTVHSYCFQNVNQQHFIIRSLFKCLLIEARIFAIKKNCFRLGVILPEKISFGHCTCY